MQTLNDIRRLLSDHGLRPKHRLGQNFLHDANQMGRMLRAAAVRTGDLVLEVGAGTGGLSEHLLEAGAELVAVEIDPDLAPILEHRLEPYRDRLTLCIGDALAGKHHLNPVITKQLGQRVFKLVANLPYNIASPLLVNLAINQPAMTGAVITVQREVADRMLASPGGKAYGPLGIMIQSLCHGERLGVLSPTCFWPAPKIESAMVQLSRRAEPLTEDPRRLSALVQQLFSKRRKQLGTILGRHARLPPGVLATARPETLSVQQLAEMAATT